MTADPCASPFALLDDDDGGALLLTAYRCTLTAGDSRGGITAEALGRFFAEVEAAARAGAWVVLAADYGLGHALEPAMRHAPDERQRLQAWVFGACAALSGAACAEDLARRLAALPSHARIAGVAECRPAWTAADHAGRVEAVRRWIAEGDCYQVNLTFPFDFRVFGDPLALYAALRARQPVRYGGFVSAPGRTIVSLSPELFFERRGARVVARPMKGTAPRGAGLDEDAARRAALLASAKERAENVMIVDLLRNDLGRLAAPGQVRVEALCAVEAYPTLWQQVSTIAADVPDASLADLWRALFPCGSITGAPKIRAMARIAELESAPRNLYTGALGWVAPDGDCRFNVAIRTFEVGAGGRARLGIGSGIVIDAEPAREYAECLLKAQFVSGFDPGFALIETMRLEDGAFPLLALHLERLQDSARALGFALDAAAAAARLGALARTHAHGVHRVRLSLAHGGELTLAAAPLDAPASAWKATIAAAPLPDGDYLRRHKTTARQRYDEALRGLPADVFDTIFLNARGEVCEGARSNVFVVRDGVWLTPPLRCGLLPGVMRRALLASGLAVEQVLTREDLASAPQVYLANALRGAVPVRLAP